MALDLSGLLGGSSGGSTTGGATGGGATDIVGAVTQGMSALGDLFPPGGLRDFMKNPIGTITKAISNLGGRTFQTGQYRLGERFMRHILKQDPGSYRNVPDEAVPAAQNFFTMALGVDVNNDEDLQTLYVSPEAYFARPDKEQVPRPAVIRAMKVMSEWPMYNPQNQNVWYIPWPLDVLFKYPSDPSTMSYFSTLINKNLPVPMTDKSTGQSTIGDNPTGEGTAKSGGKLWLWLLIIAAVIIGIVLIAKQSKKK